MIEITGRSDKGLVRENNEDRIGFDADLAIAVLADGMGGLNAGEVASSVTVETIVRELRGCVEIDEDSVEEAMQSYEAQNRGESDDTIILHRKALHIRCNKVITIQH